MPSPAGFDDPRLAALPQSPNPYYSDTLSIAGAGEVLRMHLDEPGYGQRVDRNAAPLMFGAGAVTSAGEAVPLASDQAPGTRGHVSEMLNFHGSPAPWILLFALLALGALHVEGKARVGR
jgi:hypothetical protein